jgi:cysteine synthase A
MRAEGQQGSIVTILCDGGERYAHSYYNPRWYGDCGIDIEAADAELAMAVDGAALAPLRTAGDLACPVDALHSNNS